ncbi:molybdopterin-guanine dinucleotide biosynthesis protein A [Jannaschia pagri]|uniref:Molybdopterin-guanine dinucleotide biosynthesis protein A n=2 Tax=Roseobacteraceae TaxID=2854170 RepID=A0ABQ4NNJ4_9RHOB|nr:molybdopterin-guanine dinucleotide biosynthesis protein A [Jannaschia sp. AI_61]GIT95958.1 molybdopterin-guanine dinucleotide biosynthesis protein A [Jannaschia sp. AI_62]
MRGAEKLLEEIDGTPLVLRAVRAACATVNEVIVVLPAADRARQAWLTDCPARLVHVEQRAMSASIAAGIAACQSDAALVHLADMPEIDASHLGTMVEAWQTRDCRVLRATTAQGVPGQPVIFDRTLFEDLKALQGDVGARDVIAAHGVETIALPGEAAQIDLDTPEAWEAWRAARRV